MFSLYLLKDKFGKPFATYIRLGKRQADPYDCNHDWNIAYFRELLASSSKRMDLEKMAVVYDEQINLNGRPRYQDPTLIEQPEVKLGRPLKRPTQALKRRRKAPDCDPVPTA